MLLRELKLLDYDKFIACGYAPPALQNCLAALFKFHIDVSQIPVLVSEPMVGKIKLQWWRDVINEILEGKPARPHPILQAFKGHNINYTNLLQIIDCYDDVLDAKLPQGFVELTDFIIKTEVATLNIAAEILCMTLDDKIMLAYAYNYYGRKLLKNNNILASKLFTESVALLPARTNSLFGRITKYYNKKPKGSKIRLTAALLAGNYKLL